jgi:hypothetical protein
VCEKLGIIKFKVTERDILNHCRIQADEKHSQAGRGLLTPVILATQEAEIRRIEI